MPDPSAEPRRDVRLGLALFGGGALAVATTRLAVHVPPSAAVLVVAAAVVTAALLAPERWRAAACTVATFAAGLAAAHVLLRPGLPQVHDPDHVWGLWAYARAVHAGHWLPMWLPDLGAGMPLLQFYGPVNFLLALPGVLAGWAPVALWKEAMVQAGVLSAAATFLGARLLGAGWRASLVAACALAFSPWRLAVFNLRGALGEATALIFAPLAAASALALLRAPSRTASWTLGAAIALLIPTHLITMFCLAIALVPAAIAQEWALGRGGGVERTPLSRRLLRATAPAVLGAGLVAAWWIPTLAEGKFTSLPLQTEMHRYFVYDEHGTGVSDLLVRRAWDTQRSSLRASDRAAGQEGKQMPFYVGALLFGAALTAPWWSGARATWAPALGAVSGLLFSTAPAAALMTHLPAIHKLQFPWRFLTAASILAAYAIGLGASALFAERRRLTRMIPLLALPALLIADAAPYTGAAGWVAPYHGVTHWVRAAESTGEEPFDVAMRPVPQDWSAARGLMRVGELYLPPDDTTTPVALFWIPYVEWTTPAIYRGFLSARGPRDFAEAGVSLYFLEKREQPAVVAGKPYATLERGGDASDAGPFTRSPGRIVLRPDSPAGGARLVVREQAFPGWEARVDGNAAPIVATALGFMAVDLGAGRHDVVLEFTRHTPARRAGVVVSLGTFCFFLLSLKLRSSEGKSSMSPFRSSSRRG